MREGPDPLRKTRTAIVTGAARGIGAAIAARLAADGLAVVVNYRSSVSEGEKLVTEIEKAGGLARPFRANMANSAEVDDLFDFAEAEFGPVDVLVNNAGVLKVSPLADVTDEDYQEQLTTNLTGAFNGMRLGARRIRNGGRIVNISTSIIGHYIPAHGVYVATKAAIEGMTHVLAKELGPRGITVNAVAPGPVGTELFLSTRSAEMVERITRDIPMGRLGEPDDVARVVSFLTGPDSGWVSGQVIRANGGRN